MEIMVDKRFHPGWNIIMYNNNTTPLDVVMDGLVSNGVCEEAAYVAAMVAHKEGKVILSQPAFLPESLQGDLTFSNLFISAVRAKGLQLELYWEQTGYMEKEKELELS